MNHQEIKRYNYIMNEIHAIYHDVAVRMGISDSVQSILYAICECGDRCLQSDIYKQTGISRQTINSAIRKLEKQNIVYLERGHGRKTIVCLTDTGRTVANEKARPLYDIENEIFDEWTPEEMRIYLDLTERYRDALMKKIENLP
jgi:DNA-binding MarR family transcriptional regulator